MEILPTHSPAAVSIKARKPWQTPSIVFERSLEVIAQGGPPQMPGQGPGGFIGPFGLSPSMGGVC